MNKRGAMLPPSFPFPLLLISSPHFESFDKIGGGGGYETIFTPEDIPILHLYRKNTDNNKKTQKYETNIILQLADQRFKALFSVYLLLRFLLLLLFLPNDYLLGGVGTD